VVVLGAAVSRSEPGGRAEREGGAEHDEAGVLRPAEGVDGGRDRRRRALSGAVSDAFDSDGESSRRCLPLCGPRRARRDWLVERISALRGGEGVPALLVFARRDVAEALV